MKPNCPKPLPPSLVVALLAGCATSAPPSLTALPDAPVTTAPAGSAALGPGPLGAAPGKGRARAVALEKDQLAFLNDRDAEIAREQAMKARQRADAERLREMEARNRAERQQQAEAERLQQQLAELNARQTERGLSLILSDVLFETGQATLTPGAARNLQQLAAALIQNPDRRVRIEGYTDNVGSVESNRELSERRAQAVREALAQQGVDPAQIQTAGYGEAFPVASNETPAGRLQNRRVEVIIAEKGSQVPLRGAAGRPAEEPSPGGH